MPKSKGHPLADFSMTICPYEGRECNFQCPYCHNPIRVSDIGPVDTDRPTGFDRGETHPWVYRRKLRSPG